MRILLKRSGGFTAIPSSLVLDTDQLDPAEKNNIEQMVESAHFSSLPEKIPSDSPGADRFSYVITIEEAGGRHTVEVAEASMPESLRTLIQHVAFVGRSRPKP